MVEYKGERNKKERDLKIYDLHRQGCSAKDLAPMFSLGVLETMKIIRNMKYNHEHGLI